MPFIFTTSIEEKYKDWFPKRKILSYPTYKDARLSAIRIARQEIKMIEKKKAKASLRLTEKHWDWRAEDSCVLSIIDEDTWYTVRDVREVSEQELQSIRNAYQHPMRYEACFGPNTKQWWLYDTETDEYCDPPTKVLKRVAALNDMRTADEVDDQGVLLEKIANRKNNWINDKQYRYRNIEI